MIVNVGVYPHYRQIAHNVCRPHYPILVAVVSK